MFDVAPMRCQVIGQSTMRQFERCSNTPAGVSNYQEGIDNEHRTLQVIRLTDSWKEQEG